MSLIVFPVAKRYIETDLFSSWVAEESGMGNHKEATLWLGKYCLSRHMNNKHL